MILHMLPFADDGHQTHCHGLARAHVVIAHKIIAEENETQDRVDVHHDQSQYSLQRYFFTAHVILGYNSDIVLVYYTRDNYVCISICTYRQYDGYTVLCHGL